MVYLHVQVGIETCLKYTHVLSNVGLDFCVIRDDVLGKQAGRSFVHC